MLTLKIASVHCDGPRPVTQMWFADVSRVSINGSSEDPATIDSWRTLYDAEDYTRFGSINDTPVDQSAVWPVTLITTWFGRDNDRCTSMLVERAWLLGPDGQTIERIAP